MTRSGTLARLAALALALVMTGMLSACGEIGSSASKGPMTPADIDKLCVKELADKMMVAEAKSWLDENNIKNMLAHGEKAPARRIVQELYDAGCPRVCMVNIGHAGGNQVCSTIVAELPTAPAQRQKAFATLKSYWLALEAPEMVPTDVGQAYYRFQPG